MNIVFKEERYNMMRIIFCILAISGMVCSLALAERMPPKEVAPIYYKGVKFIAPTNKMGIVEAWDIETNKKVWEKKVYQVFFNPLMERDVQDVFISSLSIEGEKLVVVNERGKRFEIDIPKNVLKQEKIVVTTDKLAYEHGDTLSYEVYNGFSKDIFIMKGQHNLNFIERQNADGSWDRFGLTMLPEVPPRPDWDPYEKIDPGSKKTYDRWLGWLFKFDDYQQFDSTPGNYRLIVEYKFDKKDKKFQEVKSNEFKISAKDSFKNKQNLSPWTNKTPYPYENEDKLLVAESYKEKWIESSVEKYLEAVQRAKEVLREWSQNPDKYEYEGKAYDYKIHVSESPNFISVTFQPIGLEITSQEVEIRMHKDGLKVLSILGGP